VLYIGVPALSMTLLYVLTRNLAVVVVTHSLVNLVSMGQAHRAQQGPATDGAGADGG